MRYMISLILKCCKNMYSHVQLVALANVRNPDIGTLKKEMGDMFS